MTPKELIIHHSATPKSLQANAAEHSFNENHKARGFPKSSLGWYIGYQYVIYGTGEVRQYRIDTEMGSHTIGQNDKSIGICLSMNGDIELPNKAQVDALDDLMVELVAIYKIPSYAIYPHRKFAKKSCYGKLLSDTWAAQLLNSAKGESIMFVKNKGVVYAILGDKLVGVSLTESDFRKDWPNADVRDVPDSFVANVSKYVLKK